MKNIFLYAKYLAHNKGAKSIGISDVRDAVKDMQYYIDQVEDLVSELEMELDIKLVKNPYNASVELEINEAVKLANTYDKINFSASVKKMITHLNLANYSIKEERVKIEEVRSGLSTEEIEALMNGNDDNEEIPESVDEEEEDFSSFFDSDGDEEDEELLESLDEEEEKIIDPLILAKKLKLDLESKIYGQSLAIEAIVDGVKNKVVSSTNMPEHTFLFLGPPATGKTYMAKTISENFEDYTYLEFSMQQFANEKDGLNIFGTESRYGNASPGELTQFVRTNPKTVVLLDEFEKAHTTIQKKLLSIFSEGYMDDLNGWIQEDGDDSDSNYIAYNSEDTDHKERTDKIIRRVDFTQTIFVITSNLGTALYNNSEFLDCLEQDYDQAETMIIQSLQTEQKREANSEVQAIVPEMLSRLSQGKILLFNKLKFSNLLTISKNIFDVKYSELAKAYHLEEKNIENMDRFLSCLLLQFAPYMDVRRVQAKIYEKFSDKVTDYLLDNDLLWKDISSIEITISKKVEKFFKKEIDPMIKDETLLRHLFRKNLTANLKFDISYKDAVISVNIETISFEKVKKVEDMIGDGGLNFSVPEETFDDIAGHETVKSRLKEITSLLKEPKKLERFEATIPKGMLLYGQPGTGKTMLAKALANHADLPFIQTTANDLIDHKTPNLSKMKEIFQRAKEYAPSIVFIDEIDSFGSRTKGGNTTLINELLTQINGFSEKVKSAHLA